MAKQRAKPQTPPLALWDVSKIANKLVFIGTVEAAEAEAARDAAAKEFKVDVWRLIAVRRR